MSLALLGAVRRREIRNGAPSEYDFVAAPLAAAVLQFAHFEQLPQEAGPAIRRVHVVDPCFGAVVFIGVLIEQTIVEVADFVHDPEYWDLIADDPDD